MEVVAMIYIAYRQSTTHFSLSKKARPPQIKNFLGYRLILLNMQGGGLLDKPSLIVDKKASIPVFSRRVHP